MKGIVETVAGVHRTLVDIFDREKRLKQELETLWWIMRTGTFAGAVGCAAQRGKGNWLQRSWRPVIMLAFTVVILVGMFTDLPMPEDTSGSGICWKSDWADISSAVSG